VNFSIVYGAGKRQVAAELGLGQKEAGAILDK
jgi:DNA polymerase I-like protein with 3'-5' exonuclease and polymerase domains